MIKDRVKKPEAGEQAAAGKVRYRVEPLADPEAIRPILEQQPAFAAFALAHLEPRLFPRSFWWRATSLPPSGGEALVMQARTGLGPSLVALGAPQALEAILRLHPGPFYTFATFQVEHAAVARRHFSLSRRGVSLRLSVSRETFQPADGAARRLRGLNLADVDALQRSEGFGFHSAVALDEGVYYGVYHADRLVAMAGTHVVAPQMGVAIVGNVVTHPHYRRRGYGAAAISAVTAALLEGCPFVLLTVEETNESALRIYSRLGYRVECRLIESGARRKDALGLASLLRRWWARSGGAVMARPKPAYRTIDERVAKEIKRLHERYPKLGHHGLAEALREAGVYVDPGELKRFLKEEGLQPERGWRPWHWRGLPSWMGGPPESPK